MVRGLAELRVWSSEVVQVSGTPESLILSPQKGHQDGSEEEIISQEIVSPTVHG